VRENKKEAAHQFEVAELRRKAKDFHQPRQVGWNKPAIHRPSVLLHSLSLLTGHYGATGALQLQRDTTDQRPFTAVLCVVGVSGSVDV
jgi:hypothetical protein